MKANELREFKHVLLARRDDLLKHRGRELEGNRQPLEPADVADQARSAHEREVSERLRQTNSHLLRAIEEALERIERGAFGICAHCGQPIGRPRLQAVPWTRLCLDCKEQRA